MLVADGFDPAYLLGTLAVVVGARWGGARGATLTAVVFASGNLLFAYEEHSTAEGLGRGVIFLSCSVLIGLLLRGVHAARTLAGQKAQRAEELANRVLRLSEDLTHTRQNVELFMSNSDVLMWLKDADFKYVMANHAAALSIGTTPSEVVGKSDFDLISSAVAEGNTCT